MNNVVFARPRHNYGSYTDFWRVVELSRFRVQYIDEIDWSAGNQTVIVPIKNFEWSSIPDRHNARLVWWTLERNGNADDRMDMANPFVPRCVDEVWTSDRSIARWLHWKFVFLGGHRAFGSTDVMHKVYNIITLMAPLPRRAKLFDELKAFTRADTGSLWGDERDLRLRQSRLMVMCHQDDLPICEPLRMMIGGSYALPMICEASEDSGYWVEGVHYLGVKLDDLVPTARVLLGDEIRRARLGAAAWRLVCVEHPFVQEVQAAL